MNTNYFVAALLLMMCTSCFRDEIDLELTDDEQKLSVQAWLNTYDEDQHIELSWSSPYLAAVGVEPIDSAVVSLAYGQELIKLEHLRSGRYVLPAGWRLEIGMSYALKIEVGDKIYEAVSVVREFPEAHDFSLEFVESEMDSFSTCNLSFELVDLAGEGDGYYVNSYPKKYPDSKNVIRTGNWISDEFLEGFSITYEQEFEDFLSVGDTMVIELHSIGAKAVSYLERIDIEIFREGLFDPPPVNVPSNISNGGVGYFTTSNSKKFELVME